MINIVIVGSGQIGSRHLQSLANLSIEANIWVMDISSKSLEIAKNRFYEMPAAKDFKGKLSFIEDINLIPNEIDFGIITSTAAVRYQILESLLKATSPKYLILEKVLFQDPEDYSKAELLLKEKKIKAFVNFPRRLFPVYQDIKTQLKGSTKIQFMVSGSNWGLACNGLHIIDLFSYLCDSSDLDISFDLLEKRIYESKRAGFIEVFGTIKGHDDKGNSFIISCNEEGTSPVYFTIHSESLIYNICQGRTEKYLTICKPENNWVPEKQAFSFPYQSQLTYKIIEDLLSNGECDLISFKEALPIHLKFINGLIHHLNSFSNEKYSICPIT